MVKRQSLKNSVAFLVGDHHLDGPAGTQKQLLEIIRRLDELVAKATDTLPVAIGLDGEQQPALQVHRSRLSRY